MTTDTELESWQREWRTNTEPMPELKKKIKRQDQQTVAAIIAVCVCLAVSIIAAVYRHSYFMAGTAAGIGFASVIMGGYILRVRRGSWKPAAQTTLAYAELSHKRAIAKIRTLHFGFYFLLCATVLFTGFLALSSNHIHRRDMIVAGLMVAELFYFKQLQRRKQQEVIETKKLIDDIKE